VWHNAVVTYNFSSGPAALPAEVVAIIQQELPDWHGTGMPVMTLSHRGPDFVDLMDRVVAKLRQALAIPSTHEVLILQGGGMGQFAAVPMNLTKPGDEVAMLITGSWGNTAAKEAQLMGLTVQRAADEAASGYTTVPELGSYAVDPGAKYLYYVPNETIGGVEFRDQPTAPVPLVADASSQILSQPMDVSAHGLVFAGTQKNLGVAGAVVVIVDKALLGHARADCPSILDYTKMARASSLLNTPTTFAVYVLGLVLDWVQAAGGVEAMAQQSRVKAGLVYDLIDATSFYSNPVSFNARSTKNIPFTLADPSLDARFLEQSEQAGLAFLAGHRTVGGMRASIYNSMPLAGVEALVDFMVDFERRHG
jgi:phosphoserine aminotransferase